MKEVFSVESLVKWARNKKGKIDPRVILVMSRILLILFFRFLKSGG